MFLSVVLGRDSGAPPDPSSLQLGSAAARSRSVARLADRHLRVTYSLLSLLIAATSGGSLGTQCEVPIHSDLV